jgi:hypothetical protein
VPSLPVGAARPSLPSVVTASIWLSPTPNRRRAGGRVDLGRLQLADVDHDAVVYARPVLKAVTAA